MNANFGPTDFPELELEYLEKVQAACDSNPVLRATEDILSWVPCRNPNCDAMGPYQINGYRCACGGDGGFALMRLN